MSVAIFKGKNAKLLTSGELENGDGQVFSKYSERNYIANHSGAVNTSGWTATGTATVTRVTSSVPRATLGYGLQFAAGAAADYVRYRFTVDSADQAKKLKISFDMVPGSYTSGDMKVDLYATSDSSYATGLTRQALSTDASSVTALPNLTGTFRTTFDASSSLIYCELRIVRVSGSSTLTLSDIVVGPGVTLQGAAVTQWQTIPGTVTQNGSSNGQAFTNTSITEQNYRRVGDSGDFEILFSFSGAPGTGTGQFTVVVPGFNLDTSRYTNSIFRAQSAFLYGGNSTSYAFGVNVGNSGSNLVLTFEQAAGNTSIGGAGSGGGFQPPSIPITIASGGTFAISLRGLPVSAWAGSGTVNLASNDLQYYYGTGGSWGTTSTVTTAQGPGGVLGGTTTPPGTNFRYTFTPTTPIPVGAVAILQTSPDGIHWTAGTNTNTSLPITIEALRYDGTNFFGAGANLNSAGNIEVYFGKYAAGTAIAWTGTWYWRVVVGLPGQAVGFGIVQPGVSSGLVSASGVPGNALTPATATAGYVGEEALSHVSTLQNINAVSGTGFNALTIPVGASPAANTISPGDWEITGTIYLSSGAATFTTNYDVYWALSGTSGNAFTGEATGINAWEFTIPAAASPSRNSFITPVLRATYDGTTLTINGQSFTSPAAGLVLKMQVNNWSGTTPQYTGTLRARRVR